MLDEVLWVCQPTCRGGQAQMNMEVKPCSLMYFRYPVMISWYTSVLRAMPFRPAQAQAVVRQ